MVEDKQTSKDSIGEVSQPKEENSFSYSNDNPNQKITISLFNGTNYLSWSRSAALSLKGRGRLEYVNGKLVPPSMEDPDFDKWDKINSVVMNWLIYSMIPEIGEEFLGLTTAKEIWDTVANTYSKRGNIAQVYDFQQSVDHLLQGELSQLNTSTNTSSSFAHSGNFASSGNLATSVSAFSSHTQLPWIIDSGASDHMTGQPSVFSSYKPYSGHDKVKIADGTFSSVSGKGLVHATSSLPLSTVLHVPSFSTNLLSISRITRDLNCSVTFFPSYCVFQDLLTKQKIGSGSEKNGLYFLDLALNKQGQSSVAHHSTVPTKATEEIWLWHQRLGHPSFYLLQFLFPSLLSSNRISSFKCENCELGKHHRVSFPISFNKSTTPFSIIHSDVWGPSSTVAISGHRWYVTFIDDFSRTTWVYLLKEKGEVCLVFKKISQNDKYTIWC